MFNTKGEEMMDKNKDMEYKEIVKSKGGRVVTINLSSATSLYYNPLELGYEDDIDIDKRLDENIIPLINSAAQIFKGFTLSEPEETKIKEIVAEGYKNQKNFNTLDLRDELIRQNNNSLDLSRVIELLNQFL